jgi:DNA-directed RNA polymerase sigma subunit (sigma70/sigma32)
MPWRVCPSASAECCTSGAVDITLAAIAPEIGVSRERVRQVERARAGLVRRPLAG